MTPSMNAAKGDFAKTVLFPGDPLRAKYIAETFFDGAREVNNVRNMLGFTGTYKGEPVSVMAHGMGIPSASIYTHELFEFYGVETIIRIGTAGGVSEDTNIRDIVVATGAGTTSMTNRVRFAGYDYPATPDFGLLKKCSDVAEANGIEAKFGNIITADLFYEKDEKLLPALQAMNILCVEMETAAIYAIAAEHRKKALSILTISDHLITGERATTEERQSTFTEMMDLALLTAFDSTP